MPITLNHTVIVARDKQRSAEFLAALLGLRPGAQTGPFVPVRVNGDLTLDFDDRHEFHAGHWAFLVDDDVFDALLGRVEGDPEIPYGAGPGHGWNREINHLGGGRGVYVGDPDGHAYEFFTAVPD
ncbi:MAG TPA: VOC family protein [Amycolatopsis sp.]|nr:VOC family protein [Amycolatopsis sp.]